MMKSMTSIVNHLANLQTEKTSGSFTHQSSGSPINPEVGINMIPVRVPQTPARQPDKLPYRWTVVLQTVVVANKIKLKGRKITEQGQTENHLMAIIEHSSSTTHQLSMKSDTIFKIQFYLDFFLYIL